MTAPKSHEPELTAGVVRRTEDVERKAVAGARATEIQILVGPSDGAPNFAMRRFIMGAGGGMPLHTNRVEHEQYVLKGRATVGIGAETFQVTAGDVLYIPGGAPHFYRVVEAPFEFLCMIPNAKDQVQILDETSRGRP